MRLRRLMGVADQIVASRFSSIDLSNKAKAKLKTALRPLKATCHYLNKKKVYSMDNQHKKIKGYRDLTQAEIDDMNAIKAMGESLKEMVEKAKSKVMQLISVGCPLLKTTYNRALWLWFVA
nr:hypothetical protein [Enterovibrio nigricans]